MLRNAAADAIAKKSKKQKGADINTFCHIPGIRQSVINTPLLIQAFLQIAPTLVITTPSSWPQNPAKAHPLRSSGASCSTLFNPAGMLTLPCPYSFQLVSSCPCLSSTIKAARLPDPGMYSMRTLQAVVRVRSASGVDQYVWLVDGIPTLWVVPSAFEGVAVVGEGEEEVANVMAEM